jgi:hypothetical protein
MTSRHFLLALALVFGVVACDSPEATRVRGGGPGADTGNRGAVVLMHEGSKPYHETPRMIPVESPPMESAQQAYEMSR